MRYAAISDFVDLQDNRHIYRAGEEYPRAGLTATEERIAELAGPNNLSNRALIKAINDDQPTAAEEPEDPKPEKQPTKKPRKKETTAEAK